MFMERQVVKSPTILVVEPDPLMLTGIAAVLDMSGYRCFLARDLTIAQKAMESMTFDLFIIAIDQSTIAAVRIANELRADMNHTDVPVIFLSPELNPESSGHLQQAGGIYCLTRPFEPEILTELVGRAIWEPQLILHRIKGPKFLDPKCQSRSSSWLKLR